MPSFEIEKDLLKKGFTHIAGIDEAGRGALAGPLSVGMVVYSADFFSTPTSAELAIVEDSKQLTPKKREAALQVVNNCSALACFTLVSHKIVDQYNVNGATRHAICKLLESSPLTPDIVIMDGNMDFDIGVPLLSIIKGDSKSISIASASIVAKVNRDMVLEKFSAYYPEYGFSRNKGYGTREHREAIADIGPSPVHRKTYEPLKSILKNIHQ